MAESTKQTGRKRGKNAEKLLQMPQNSTQEALRDSALEPAEPAETAQAGESAPPDPIIAVSKKPFPLPPKGKGKGGYCTEEEGMRYWRSLAPEFLNRGNFYVNREEPVLNRLQELPEAELLLIQRKAKRPPAKYIDKPAEAFGEDTRQEFLSRYGSGAYKVYINDAGVRGAKEADLQSHNLCKFWVVYWDSDYPPVLDPSRADKGLGILDLAHPKNASYVAELRMRGVIPREGENEMAATNDVVGKLAEKVGTLADQVAQGKQAELLTEIKNALKGGGGGGDANAAMFRCMELMITMNNRPAAAAPAVDQSQSLIAIFTEQMKTMREDMKAEREERRKLEDSIRAKAEQPPVDPFTYFERMGDMFAKAKTIFGGAAVVAGTDGIAATAAKHVSKMSGTLEFLSEVIPKIMDAPILNALAQRITANSAGGAPAVSMGAIAQTGAHASAAPMNRDELLKFVQEIVTPAMFNYLNDDAPGGDFASWIYAGFPPRLRELQVLGPAMIVATYQQSGAWRQLQHREQAFRTFVEEFCRWRPPVEAAGEEEGTGSRFEAGNGTVIDLDAQLEGDPIEGRPM